MQVLRYLRHYIRQEVQQYVDTQYRLTVDASGKRAILEAALAANLTQIPTEYRGELRRVIEKLAEQLARDHRRKRRRARRGQLDIKHTLRANIAFDETLFRLKWRRQKPRKSHRVRAVRRQRVGQPRRAIPSLSPVRSQRRAAERAHVCVFEPARRSLSDQFRDKPIEVAIEEALFDWGKGNTDYGRAFLDFRDLALNDVNHRSTVIILGDARNNFYEPHVDRLKAISQRAKRVLWLNPEPRENWGEGDSEMLRFAPHCFRVSRCNSLPDLERFAEALIATQR